ncbi:MAG: SDR family NAD(P)-dependent oxidoreductase, partial [Zoogloea sp.]|nr:SDR family NAD(P)-dependent oxidoreductase [Zoogloea sp.]
MNLISYILSEVKNKKLSRAEAAELIGQLQARTVGGTASSVPLLHPLVQSNSSTLEGQRYSSTFTGEEFFLAQHVVQGRKVLPGVAYLEMAREALSRAGAFEGQAGVQGVRLSNVVWARPIVVDGKAVTVHIGLDELQAQGPGRIGYEIYGEQGELHSQGVAQALVERIEGLDLAALQGRCGQGRLEGAQCYEGYERVGLSYGPSYRAIEHIELGQGQALARLQLAPGQALDGALQLHPGLLDAALQSCVALIDPAQGAQLALPFGLESIDIQGRCSRQMWALVHSASGSQERVRKYDITLADAQGQVVARIRGYSSRVVAGRLEQDRLEQGGAPGQGAEPAPRSLILRPQWQPGGPATEPGPVYAQRHLMGCGVDADVPALADRLQAQALEIQTPQGGTGDALAQGYERCVLGLIERAREIVQGRPAGPVLLQVVVPAQGPLRVLAGLAGALHSARREQPRLIGQLIEVPAGQTLQALAEQLEQDAARPHDRHIRHLDGQRQVLGWQEVEPDLETEAQDAAGSASTVPPAPWKAGGVYLLSGGLGGLGRILAEQMARQAPGATLVLTGRRALDEAGRHSLRALEALGATARYLQLDVSDAQAVRQAVQQIQEDHQTLDGIVHAAGVLQDSLLANKSEAQIRAVLAAKVQGLIHLDQASRAIELDWFIALSSISAVVGSAGQTDYAAANGFMDAYLEQRQAQVAQGQGHGRSLSINWPLWRDGGMHIDEASARSLRQSTGLHELPTAQGLQALQRIAAGGGAQAMV